jgi:hypothetical protein
VDSGREALAILDGILNVIIGKIGSSNNQVEEMVKTRQANVNLLCVFGNSSQHVCCIISDTDSQGVASKASNGTNDLNKRNKKSMLNLSTYRNFENKYVKFEYVRKFRKKVCKV